MKNILIVDDSALMRRMACDIIESDSRFHVEDIARNGLEALDLLEKKSYDAIVLDVNMPRMTGLELLKEMQNRKMHCRVMMFSTTTSEGARETLEALELGALDFIQKPSGVAGGGEEEFRRRFLEILSTVSRSYLTRTTSAGTVRIGTPLRDKTSSVKPTLRTSVKVLGEKIVAIASSTGGPKALQVLIPKLPANLNAPVLLVQHMPVGFTKSLAERLDELSPIHVKEAEDGEKIVKGTVYVAQGGRHMKLFKEGASYVLRYSDEPTREGVRPCANYMYESLMNTGFAEVCCTVLTGMGADGTAGIKNLIEKKPVHIIAQDEDSCAVYGMPKAIAMTGLVNEVLPIDGIADAIVKEVGTL